MAGEMKLVKDATCTEAGSKQQVCTVCGSVLATEEIPAKGHVPGELMTTQEPGCEDHGTTKRFCTVCGEVLEIGDLPPAGHDWQDVYRTESTSTYTNSGAPVTVYTDVYDHSECNRCGARR